MSTTKTQIANLALAKFGGDRLTLLDEDSPTAEKVRLHYVPVLSELLRAAQWGFAITRVSTARLANPLFGWSAAFQLPQDCVQILEVNGVNPESTPDLPFSIEGGQILCDADTCLVRYIRLEEDPNAYPADFIEAFATLLAARVCTSITGNFALAQQFEAKCFGQMLPKAASQGNNESRGHRNDRTMESDLVRSRWG